MKPSEVLRQSAEHIKRGWVRNQYSHAGRVCSLGAIQLTLEGNAGLCRSSDVRNRTISLLAQAMKEQFPAALGTVDPVPGALIVEANDLHAKNRQEIIRAFEKAAAHAEEQGE